MLFSTIWQDAQLPNGTRIYSSKDVTQDENETGSKMLDDDSFSFNNVDCILEGDILLRCRHIDSSTGKGVPMFRIAFYTGFVPAGEVLRLKKNELDGITDDDRFDDEMFIDMVFAPVNTKAGREKDQSQDATSADRTLESEYCWVHGIVLLREAMFFVPFVDMFTFHIKIPSTSLSNIKNY